MGFDFIALLKAIVLAFPVAVVSVTISKSKFFDPPRKWIKAKTEKRNGGWASKVVNFFHELVYCPYCTSHWIAFIFVLLYQPIPFSCGYWLIDLYMVQFMVTAFAVLIGGVINSMYDFKAE